MELERATAVADPPIAVGHVALRGPLCEDDGHGPDCWHVWCPTCQKETCVDLGGNVVFGCVVIWQPESGPTHAVLVHWDAREQAEPRMA